MYWGDYLKDTGHLTTAQHGAYLLLIGHYWSTGEPLPDDDSILWRIVRADSQAQWKKLRPAVAAFFTAEDGKLRHRRIDAELAGTAAKAEAARKKAQEAANARWAGRGPKPDYEPEGTDYGDTGADAPSIPGASTKNAPSISQALLGQCLSQPQSELDHPSPKNPPLPFGEREGAAHAAPTPAPRKRKAPRNGWRTLLPDGWQPSADGRAYAERRGLDPDKIAKKFCNTFRGSRTKNADWDKRFEIWCDEDAERRGSAQARTVSPPRGNDGVFERLAAIAHRGGNEEPDGG